MKQKFAIGQKVRIRKDMDLIAISLGFPISSDMKTMCGNEYYIRVIKESTTYGDLYYLKNERGYKVGGIANDCMGWSWKEELLEKVVESNKKMKFVKKGV